MGDFADAELAVVIDAFSRIGYMNALLELRI